MYVNQEAYTYKRSFASAYKKMRRRKHMAARKIAFVDEAQCVACGSCIKVCPRGAIAVPNGITAVVDEEKCVGCGICAKACPASVISSREKQSENKRG
nr:4Fe-4S binding protein [Anaerosporobacter sp.]